MKQLRTEDGGALVELAVAMPLILLLIFAAFQIVFIVSTKTLLDHAAFEGARTAAVHFERGRVTARVDRALSAAPRGAGFLAADPRVSLGASGSLVTVQIEAKVGLLPFFRQAAALAGSDGTVYLQSTAGVGKEPWTGFESAGAE